MKPPRTIVVTGATGTVGGQVLAQLAGSGVAVRAVGRDADTLAAVAARHGAEPCVADLTEPASLEPALDGADAVFLVFPSVTGDPAAAGTVAALAGHGRRIVYLSAFDQRGTPRPDEGGIMGSHALLERTIRAAAAEWTFLRSSGFAGNTLAWADQIRRGDTLRWIFPGAVRSLVHEADLAAVGVRALLDEGHDHVAHHLTGPQQLDQVQMLDAIGAAVGRTLRFEDVGEAAAAEVFAGVPEAMLRSIVDGQRAFIVQPEPVSDTVETILGRPALPYAQWARDHVADFRRAVRRGTARGAAQRGGGHIGVKNA